VLGTIEIAAAKVGVKDVGVHTLRHSAAVAWLEAGVHIKAVADLLSFLVPFGDARACGKIGCGRSPRSVFLGAVSPFLSLIRGADGGAAHCCREHEGPTLSIPVRFLRATAWL